MSGDFYFKEGTVEIETFEKQMLDNGVKIANVDPHGFRIHVKSGDDVFAYVDKGTKYLRCLTRYGDNDSTWCLELLTKLGYEDIQGYKPNEAIHL